MRYRLEMQNGNTIRYERLEPRNTLKTRKKKRKIHFGPRKNLTTRLHSITPWQAEGIRLRQSYGGQAERTEPTKFVRSSQAEGEKFKVNLFKEMLKHRARISLRIKLRPDSPIRAKWVRGYAKTVDLECKILNLDNERQTSTIK